MRDGECDRMLARLVVFMQFGFATATLGVVAVVANGPLLVQTPLMLLPSFVADFSRVWQNSRPKQNVSQ